MPQKLKTVPPDALSRLQRLVRETKNPTHLRHIQCVLLRLVAKLKAPEIAESVGYSAGYVRHIQSAWFRRGDDTLFPSENTGHRRRQNMTLAQEKDLLDTLRDKACSGLVVEADPVRQAYEARTGRKTHPSVIYRMLHRHGWRKIRPRPRHPKSSLQAQEDYKKKPSPSR
jgi:transposase